ncbi:MAG TPA: ABC transporter permease subunit, partial [Verrucomicrobiota bacterium]|nr:ABC transporter permease subunit [Verrucomicrobiota bacterium]
MNVLPVAARGVRVIARRRELYWTRFTAAAVAVALAAFMLAVARESPPFIQAHALFSALSGFALVFAHFAGLRTTADCLSEEKREGTLGLLLLTDLRPLDVIAGKVLASSASALAALVALLPVLALPLLLGGVPADLVGKMALLLLNTIFLSLAAGVLVSALCRGAQQAMGWTLVLLLAVGAGPFVLMAAAATMEASWLQRWLANLAVWQPPGTTRFDWLTVASPMSGFIALLTGGLPGGGGLIGSYPATMIALQLLGWLFLGGALVALPRTWRDRALNRPRRDRQAAVRAGAFTERAPMLHPHPFAWLVQRN